MLKHMGTKKIETERLILRKFEKDDVQDMFNNWSNDADVTQYLSWNAHSEIGVTKLIISNWVNAYENMETYIWGIVPKDYGKVAGSISVIETSDKNMSCEIGYCLSKNYWNKGLMTEALCAVIDYLMNDVKMNRIFGRNDPNNLASDKVMKKAGMSLEGTLREVKHLGNDIFSDSNIWSILKKEYKK